MSVTQKVKLGAYNVATVGASNKAINESLHSQLPGRTDGPADAYRHILLAAELTRLTNEAIARAILGGHEQTGNADGQTPQAENMDRRNNDIGIEIGKNADSWEDVVRRSRGVMDDSRGADGGLSPEAGSGGDGAVWYPPIDWKENPLDDTTVDPKDRIPTDDPRLNFPPTWPEGPFEGDWDHKEPPKETLKKTSRFWQNTRIPPAEFPHEADDLR